MIMSREIHLLHSQLWSLSKHMNLMEHKVAMTDSTCMHYLSLIAYKNLMVWKMNGNVKYANVENILPSLISFSSHSSIFLTSTSAQHPKPRIPRLREYTRVHRCSSSTRGAPQHWHHQRNTPTGSQSRDEDSSPYNQAFLCYLKHIVLEI